MHIPTSFSQKKLHVIRTKKSTYKLDFFLFQFSNSKKKKKNSMHIPTSFSQKNCMLFEPRNQHANWIFFFSSFPAQKKKQHAYTNIILTKKLHVIQIKKLTCKLDFFFQFSSSEKQHAYTNIILPKKLHVIRTKKSTCKLDFFFNFPAQKNIIHSLGSLCSNPTIQVYSTCSRTANSGTKIQPENMSQLSPNCHAATPLFRLNHMAIE